MTDEPIELDGHRGMIAQKDTEIRRRLHEVQVDQAELRERQAELEKFLIAAPALRFGGYNDGVSGYGGIESREIGRRAEAQRIAGAEHATAPHGYVPGVDGLRCLAILSVLLFHGGIWRNGWVGVWLFFVISGFVVTRPLLADAVCGFLAWPSFRRFYLT